MNGLHWVILGSFSTCPGGMRRDLCYLAQKSTFTEKSKKLLPLSFNDALRDELDGYLNQVLYYDISGVCYHGSLCG